MSDWLTLLWIMLAALPVGWVVSAVAAGMLAQVPVDRRLDPRTRIRRVWLVALLPWVSPLVLLLALAAPAAAKSLELIADHCLSHGIGHPHLCLEHLPALALAHWHWLAVFLATGWFGFIATRYAMVNRKADSRLRTMACLARSRGRLRILDTAECVAFAADPGGRPLILVSRGLLEHLGPRERRIVLAHEAAHLRHRDPIQSRWLEWLLLAHWPTGAARLRRIWHQAVEERTDESVATRFGADQVARTIVDVARATAGREVPALSAAGADTLQRIDRLLSGRAWTSPIPVYEVVYATTVAAVACAIADSHHAIETLLGILM